MTEVLNDAIADYEQKQFWQTINEQIEHTQRERPEEWADYLAERDLVLGRPSHTRRMAPEWEGLITFPEERNETDTR